jgi:predicted PurR-regulated permease PerM
MIDLMINTKFHNQRVSLFNKNLLTTNKKLKNSGEVTMMATDNNSSGCQNIPEDDRRIAESQTRSQQHFRSPPELRALLSLTVAALVTTALYFGKDVFIPITLATALSFVLAPLVDMLQRARLWRGPAVFLSVVSALGIIGLIGALIGSQTSSLAEQAPRYAQTIESKIQHLETMASSGIQRLTGRNVTLETSGERLSPAHTITPHQQGSAAATPDSTSNQPSTSPLMVARMLVGPILVPLETLVIVFVVAVFVLMQKEDLHDRFVHLSGAHDLYRTTIAIDDGTRRLRRYFVAQLLVNSSFGVVIGLGLWFIGIPSAAMWGVLAGLLRFVPYIGSFMAALAPMALAAAIEPGWSTAVYVALLFGVVEPLTGYALEPLLYGHSTGLSPISVIVAALFWTWLWGLSGSSCRHL